MNPVTLYRLYHKLHSLGMVRFARTLYRLNYFVTKCSIPPSVIIGTDPTFADFGAGIILNHNVILGDNVTLLPHVVLGQNVRGHGLAVDSRIIVGHRVVIGAGAKVIASGLLEIGDDTIIGANAVVLRSLPPSVVAVGVPATYKSRQVEGAPEDK